MKRSMVSAILISCFRSSWLGPTILFLFMLERDGIMALDWVGLVFMSGLLVGLVTSTLHSLLLLPLFVRVSRPMLTDSNLSGSSLWAHWFIGHQVMTLALTIPLTGGISDGYFDGVAGPLLFAAQSQAALVLWYVARRITQAN